MQDSERAQKSDRARVVRYARRHVERTGDDPTFRKAAKALRLSLDAIEDACEDAKGHGDPIDITVAFGIPGVGVGDTMPRSEWEIEYYGKVR
jgi:hypothetical protein